MKFKKRHLAKADQGYSVTSISLLNRTCILAAAEGEGPGLVFTTPDLTTSVLAAGPGGCMGFAPVPGHSDEVLMISRFYPIFKAESAGVHRYRATDGFSQPWTGERVVDLPFVHRIATVSVSGNGYLVAATVCGGKEFEQDWSSPGAVYVARVPEQMDGQWDLVPVLEGIHQNHGMNVGTYKGKETVFISGTEGVFALKVPERETDAWESERIIDTGVSEIYPFDLDGDGVDEIAVIEPFHGDTVAVYRQSAGTWDRVFEAPLEFGHGLWAGRLGGEAVVLVGNRAGTANLCCYSVRSASPFEMEEIVVDENSGTTNMAVVDLAGTQAIVASNANFAEYALYTVE